MISTNICHVTVEDETLSAVFPPPSRGALSFLVFFALVGLASVVCGLVGLISGWNDAALAILSGVAILCILLWSLRDMRAMQGTRLIDRDGIRWTRDQVEVGSWSRANVTLSIRRCWSWQSYPPRLGREYWLTATSSSGSTLYLAHGLAEEVSAVRSWIEACWGRTDTSER